jgi:16S rRNA (cytosine967-C5)-methyltransferase
MKLHKNLIDAIIHTLQQIFNEGKYADKAIEKVLAKDKRWGARDRAFIAENAYDMVRWWRLLSYISGETKIEHEDKLTYEKGWHMFGIWLLISGKELPNWQEFKKIKEQDVAKLSSKANDIRKIRESVPDWLDELGEKELGKQWDEELKAMNETAAVVIRANTLKITKQGLGKLLYDEEIETIAIPGYEDALVLKRRANLFKTSMFKDGLFEVQDAASQKVAEFLDLQPGMRVIDACAGAGGKALHIAALLQNKGRVIAMDVEQWKLDEMKKRARRNGVQNIEAKLIDGTKTIKRLQESADRLLLDVPCSGLGVLKRNPDAKWKLDLDFVNRIKQVQREILSSYPTMLKKGGKVVYATCSLLPSEGEEQVNWFLENHPGYTLEKELRISPAKTGFDGFYMALIQKN